MDEEYWVGESIFTEATPSSCGTFIVDRQREATAAEQLCLTERKSDKDEMVGSGSIHASYRLTGKRRLWRSSSAGRDHIMTRYHKSTSDERKYTQQSVPRQ